MVGMRLHNKSLPHFHLKSLRATESEDWSQSVLAMNSLALVQISMTGRWTTGAGFAQRLDGFLPRTLASVLSCV